MSRIVVIAVLACTGILLIGLGVWLNTWWTIAAGVCAASGAAWVATEPSPQASVAKPTPLRAQEPTAPHVVSTSTE